MKKKESKIQGIAPVLFPWWIRESCAEDGYYLRNNASQDNPEHENWECRTACVIIDDVSGMDGKRRECVGHMGIDSQLRRDGVVPMGSRLIDFYITCDGNYTDDNCDKFGVIVYGHPDFPVVDDGMEMPVLGEWREKERKD